MLAWIPKQGWFKVAYVLGYRYRTDDLGTIPVADVVLFDGSVLEDVTLQYNLIIGE